MFTVRAHNNIFAYDDAGPAHREEFICKFGSQFYYKTLRVIFCKVQTGVIHQCHRFSPNLVQSDLITYIATWQNFFPESLLVLKILLLEGGGLMRPKPKQIIKCSNF